MDPQLFVIAQPGGGIGVAQGGEQQPFRVGGAVLNVGITRHLQSPLSDGLLQSPGAALPGGLGIKHVPAQGGFRLLPGGLALGDARHLQLRLAEAVGLLQRVGKISGGHPDGEHIAAPVIPAAFQQFLVHI